MDLRRSTSSSHTAAPAANPGVAAVLRPPPALHSSPGAPRLVAPHLAGGGSGHDAAWRLGGSCPASRATTVCMAYRRGSSFPSSDPNYYELLGLDPDCDEEDIRTAFRRRAKEVHPDLNKDEGATEAFVQLSRAYEVLSDPESRREYDMVHRTRRMNFFRDIEEEEEGDRFGGSPFRWSRVGRRPSGLRPDDDDDDDNGYGAAGGGRDAEEGGAGPGRDGEGEDGDEDERGPGWRRRRGPSEEEFLEELAKFMSGGSLRAFQSGRLDPWGTSTNDAWFRQVERQTRTPYGPSRQGYGSSRDDEEDTGREWDPSRRVPGWSPPGRGSEWSHPRRQWDEEDRRGGGGGGPGRQGGGGGDFRRPFKI